MRGPEHKNKGMVLLEVPEIIEQGQVQFSFYTYSQRFALSSASYGLQVRTEYITHQILLDKR
jgi:hypothetical protein